MIDLPKEAEMVIKLIYEFGTQSVKGKQKHNKAATMSELASEARQRYGLLYYQLLCSLLKSLSTLLKINHDKEIKMCV